MHTLLSRFRFLVAAVLLVGGSRTLSAADAPAPAAPKAAAYRIVPTDKVSVIVVGEPDLSVVGRRVDVNGNINLNLVQEVRVAGLTVSEAQTAVENAYRDGRYLRNPQVTINIEEYAPREVTVSGFVKFPAKVNIPPETVMTLKDVIAKCGGFTDTANGKNVKVTRILPDGTTKTWDHLDVESILLGKVTGKTEASTFIVEPGDTVYVPERII